MATPSDGRSTTGTRLDATPRRPAPLQIPPARHPALPKTLNEHSTGDHGLPIDDTPQNSGRCTHHLNSPFGTIRITVCGVRSDSKGDGRVRVHDRDRRGDDRSCDGRDHRSEGTCGALARAGQGTGREPGRPRRTAEPAHEERTRDRAGSGTDRAPRPRARPDTGRSEHAERHQVKDRADRDRPGRD